MTLEYKVQIYTPPYLLTGRPRPVISAAPEAVTWNQQYSLQWSGTPSIDRVVLQKMSDNTHCLAFDLRQVCGRSIALQAGLLRVPDLCSIVSVHEQQMMAVQGVCCAIWDGTYAPRKHCWHT